MRKKAILRDMLALYAEVIYQIKDEKDISNAYDIVANHNLEHGICLATKRYLNKEISHKEWVKKHCKGMYWGPTVCQRYNLNSKVKDFIEALQLRVDIMQQELALPWWKF